MIVVSDEDRTPSSPGSGGLHIAAKLPLIAKPTPRIATPNNAHHHHHHRESALSNAHHSPHSHDEDSPPPSTQVDALRELLEKEEQKLTIMKGLRSSNSPSAAPPNITISSRHTSSGALNNSHTTSTKSIKHSIVVVPGNQKSSSSVRMTNASSGISNRLQQLVDTIAVDQALNSKQFGTKAGGVAKVLRPVGAETVCVTATPPVPSLTSISTSAKRQTMSLINDTIMQLSNSIPPLKPNLNSTSSFSHEVITISDSPVTSAPPPLLPSLPRSTPSLSTLNPIQVPTISTVSSNPKHTSTAVSQSVKEQVVMQAVENSRQYKDFLMKESHAQKNFQKQMDRKLVLAPYPKTFRPVWPIIPVHDPSFMRSVGLETVCLHFDANLKATFNKTNNASKVKPICNQCGCDFASAWQIRKSNSKQLLLCEACDFQNLKILQRSKLSNQLKELLESIRKDEEKFEAECEEARKQVVALQKQELRIAVPVINPPPLTSQLNQRVITSPALTSLNPASLTNHVIQATATTDQKLAKRVKPAAAVYPTTRPSALATARKELTIPSILGQTSQHTSSTEVINPRKRKDVSSSQLPPSKTFKPGSAIDQTLSKLSHQLIKRKLDEQRQECQQMVEKGGGGGEEGNRRSRRKGTPKHKRLLSASSE